MVCPQRHGSMVPFDAFISGDWTVGAQSVELYNEQPAYEIIGAPGNGVSSGQAMAEVQKLMATMPKGVGMEWTGLSYEQVAAGSQTSSLYAISILFVLLCLAALYESWSIPVAVMLVVPLGIIGAVIANLLRGIDNDVYFQIGLLTTMGLAVKNAILIVEFARDFFEKGETLVEAALHAARERLRPILMTSIAFVCGTFPLAIASGAGAGARTAIGTAVVGGMVHRHRAGGVLRAPVLRGGADADQGAAPHGDGPQEDTRARPSHTSAGGLSDAPW